MMNESIPSLPPRGPVPGLIYTAILDEELEPNKSALATIQRINSVDPTTGVDNSPTGHQVLVVDDGFLGSALPIGKRIKISQDAGGNWVLQGLKC